jgi:hypothetical protein
MKESLLLIYFHIKIFFYYILPLRYIPTNGIIISNEFSGNGEIKLEISIDMQITPEVFILTKSENIYISSTKIEENTLTFSNIKIKAILIKGNVINKLTIKTHESSFTYIKRGEIIYDSFVNSKINYYSSDLGKYEKGVVSLNLIKGRVKVYGRILEKHTDEINSIYTKGFVYYSNENNSIYF